MSKTGKEAALGQIMDELTVGDLCLAFSGGVDSSLLLKMAADRAAAKGTGKGNAGWKSGVGGDV